MTAFHRHKRKQPDMNSSRSGKKQQSARATWAPPHSFPGGSKAAAGPGKAAEREQTGNTSRRDRSLLSRFPRDISVRSEA